ncbi:MAG: lytic transglycosylase domain-containing protein [Thermoanaerobaculia bacterium]
MTLRLLVLLAVSLAFVPMAQAEIAVFTDGRSLKITGYETTDDVVELTLKSGGKVHLPIERVERILDDEVVAEDVVAEIKADGVLPQRSYRFQETSRPLFASKFDDKIVEAARKFDVDAALVSAVIKAESDYNPKVVSRKGARGLMQLMPATARRFGVANSFNEEQNIYGGTRYLRWLLDTFEGNADHAVAAYNAGEGNVWKYDGVPPFRETVNYLAKIGRHLRTVESTGGVANSTSLR